MSQITSAEELRYWIAFNLVLGDRLQAAKILADFSPSPRSLFRKSAALPPGLDATVARELRQPELMDRASAELERAEREGYTILTRQDPRYPGLLRETFDPPYVLYCAGDPDVLNTPSVSIVGSRKPTPYGRNVAEKLSRDIAGCGITIVSGMARGIDSMAHIGALKEGRTIAVLGSGLENIYPRENRPLADKIRQNGAVLSEFPLDSKPLGFHFPIRNRVISGLSRALIVIEAAPKSGSLISAKLALEQNREVLAVPGNITSDKSRGTNWLIQSGAKLVMSVQDVLEELPPEVLEDIPASKMSPKTPVKLSADEKEVYNLLPEDKASHIEDIVSASGRSVSEVLTLLLGLELNDLVRQLPGKYFQRKL